MELSGIVTRRFMRSRSGDGYIRRIGCVGGQLAKINTYAVRKAC